MNVRWKANNDVRLPGVGNTILTTGLTLLKFTQQLISSIPGKSWCGLSDVVCIQGSLRFQTLLFGCEQCNGGFSPWLKAPSSAPFQEVFILKLLNLMNPVG